MSQRTTKKSKSKDQAIVRASEEAPITRHGRVGPDDHLYYANKGVRVDHLSPRARKMLGAREF